MTTLKQQQIQNFQITDDDATFLQKTLSAKKIQHEKIYLHPCTTDYLHECQKPAAANRNKPAGWLQH